MEEGGNVVVLNGIGGGGRRTGTAPCEANSATVLQEIHLQQDPPEGVIFINFLLLLPRQYTPSSRASEVDNKSSHCSGIITSSPVMVAYTCICAMQPEHIGNDKSGGQPSGV